MLQGHKEVALDQAEKASLLKFINKKQVLWEQGRAFCRSCILHFPCSFPMAFPWQQARAEGGVCSDVCNDLVSACYGTLCSFLAWGDPRVSPGKNSQKLVKT